MVSEILITMLNCFTFEADYASEILFDHVYCYVNIIDVRAV